MTNTTDTATTGMTIERAKEINSACCQHMLWNMGVQDDEPPSLDNYSLMEMLQASEIMGEHTERINDKTTRRYTHCDPRILAALYTLYHYRPSDIENVEIITRLPNGAAIAVFMMDEQDQSDD